MADLHTNMETDRRLHEILAQISLESESAAERDWRAIADLFCEAVDLVRFDTPDHKHECKADLEYKGWRLKIVFTVEAEKL